MQASILKRVAMLAIAGAFVTSAVTTSFARDRGLAIGAGIAAGAVIGAAAAASSGPYYDEPYDTGPVYAAPEAYYAPGPGYYYGNTNSLGPNRAQMEHSN
jgi:hypothetical protein